jgi:hypothetical protein
MFMALTSNDKILCPTYTKSDFGIVEVVFNGSHIIKKLLLFSPPIDRFAGFLHPSNENPRSCIKNILNSIYTPKMSFNRSNSMMPHELVESDLSIGEVQGPYITFSGVIEHLNSM